MNDLWLHIVGISKICHNALICFLNVIMSLQTKLAALTQLNEGKFSQVTDNMEKSLTLRMRRQETCDTNKGWTMFHMMIVMMMMMMMTTLTTPDPFPMHGRFTNEGCVTFLWLALHNIYTIYSQQHTLIHILLNELHIKIRPIITNRKQSTKPT